MALALGGAFLNPPALLVLADFGRLRSQQKPPFEKGIMNFPFLVFIHNPHFFDAP
jgi:hypothetical protein